MLKLGSRKGIGTPVRCPSCRYPNLAIDIWCERCGAPLDWQRKRFGQSATTPAEDEPEATPILPAAAPRARRTHVWTFPKVTLPAVAIPRIHLRQVTLPRWKAVEGISRLRFPLVPRTVAIVAVVVVVLLLVPLMYVALPMAQSLAGRKAAVIHSPLTSASQPGSESPQAAAIAGVRAKTGLTYAGKCTGNAPCLSIVGQTLGQGAAAIVFSTAASGGRECAGYVFERSGKWQLLDATCGLPGQVTPLVGHDATVHVPGNCANVHDAASLKAGVVACIRDGTVVRVDRGPVFADGLIWWHLSKGWMAHDFLVAP